MEKPVARSRPRRGTETRQRQRRLTYRITETEYAQVEAAASASGLTLASYARAQTVSAPITRARRRGSFDDLALARALTAVNRMGGNLHQLVRYLNFNGIPHPGEIVAAVKGYDEMVAALMASLGRKP